MPVYPPIPYTDRFVQGVYAVGTISMIALYLRYSPTFDGRVLALFVIAGFCAWLMSVIVQHRMQQFLVYAACAVGIWQGGDLIRQGIEVTINGVGFAIIAMPFVLIAIQVVTPTRPVGTNLPNGTLNPEVRERVMNNDSWKPN